MKNKTAILLMALGLTLPAVTFGQDADPGPARRGPRPPRFEGGFAEGQRPMPPLFVALDVNHDGVIDADEIAKASESLKALDKNGDGKLTPEELRPPRLDAPGDGQNPNGPGPRRPRPRGDGQ